MSGAGNDLTIYEDFAHEWWQRGSFHFASLQNITPFRLSLIREYTGDPRGKIVLDMGCGGGLLAVPLIDAGAVVTGVDISPGSIKAAENAANGRGRFMCMDIRRFTPGDNPCDLVLLADVIDHITEYPDLLKKSFRALKPGGALFVSTINRTFLSKILAIKAGEGLGLIPPGTHDWSMFVRPCELKKIAEDAGLKLTAATGEWPLIFKSLISGSIYVRKSKSMALGYAMVFRKD